MPLGVAYANLLTDDARNALTAASVMLLDEVFADVAALEVVAPEVSEVFSQTYMSRFLPRRYEARYTLQFARRFVTACVVVVWKLAQADALPLSCVAEQLAARCLTLQTEALLEQQGTPAELGGFEDAISDGAELELLFDRSYVEPTALANADAPKHSHPLPDALTFEHWFVGFVNTGAVVYPAVHPYLVLERDPATQFPQE